MTTSLTYTKCYLLWQISKEFLITTLSSLFLLSIILSQTGCNSDSLSKANYVHWLNDRDHGLKQQQWLGKFEYEAFIMPPEFCELKFDQGSFKDTGVTVFQFRIFESGGKNILSVIDDKVNNINTREYLNFYFVRNFQLITKDKIFNASSCIYDNTSSLTPYINCIVFFETPYNNEKKTLVFNDELISQRDLKFVFNKEVLKAVPELNNSL